MAKRLLDTELFNDPWFMELSPNAKLIFIYIITNCDHAGVFKFNWKLVEFQTGIKGLYKGYESLLKEFGERLKKLENDYFWIPKFIEHQYPGFPNSKVKAQSGAIRILLSHNISSYKNKTLPKPLLKGYEYGNENGSGNEKGGTGVRTGIPMTQKQVEEFYKKHGHYPKQRS